MVGFAILPKPDLTESGEGPLSEVTWMAKCCRAGDVLELELDGVGTLRHQAIDEN